MKINTIKLKSMFDKIDLKILDKLQVDSRLSFAEIGRMIQLSASAVRERVLKMEDSGLIKRYGIDINYQYLGYDLEAFILVKVFHGKLKSFLKYIPQLSEVKKAYRITGNENVHLQVVLKNQLHLQSLIDKIMPYGDTKTLLILSDVSQSSN